MDVLQSLHKLVVLALHLVELESLHVVKVAALSFKELLDFVRSLLDLMLLTTVVDADDVLAVHLEISAHVQDFADSSIG